MGRVWCNPFVGLLGGGVAGFLLGATFWIVLGLQGSPGGAAPTLQPFADPAGVNTPGCTSLAIDRRKGHTTAEACLGQVLALREGHATGLGDRALP